MPARRSRTARPRRAVQRTRKNTATRTSIIAALDALERDGGSGRIDVAPGKSLELSHLDKVFFPDTGATKGDVMRYYAQVADYVLPAIADRPLVLKRTPDGVGGELFFQQNAHEPVPDAVRVENVAELGEAQRRFVGGDLPTLLHVVQLGCISLDPWMSRIGTLDTPDYAIIDLDPGPAATFKVIVRVARWLEETLAELGLHSVPKTSGSRGIHIAIPMPRATTYRDAVATAQTVASRVVEKHARQTTFERALDDRPRGAVYIDCLQNARGKSVASAYSVRAKPEATVSAPLAWDEVVESLDPRDFTIATMRGRLDRVGDLWRLGLKQGNSAAAVRGAAGRPDKRRRSGAGIR